MITACSELMREGRTKKGLSQIEVAKKLGLESAQFISNIERGCADIPPMYVKKLSKVIGADTSEILRAIIVDKTREIIHKAGLSHVKAS